MWPLIYLPVAGPAHPGLCQLDGGPARLEQNDTDVTVKLKHYMWSDGTPVTARDVVFYINLGKAMGATWGNYGGPRSSRTT